MPVYFTSESLARYREYVKSIETKLDAIMKKMDHAYETGGYWHDNPDFETLENDAKIENSRLSMACALLTDVAIIEYPIKVEDVVLGSEVSFKRDGKTCKLQIVAYGDEDTELDRIRYDAPIAQALMLHKKGDIFKAAVAKTESAFEILDIAPIPKKNA